MNLLKPHPPWKWQHLMDGFLRKKCRLFVFSKWGLGGCPNFLHIFKRCIFSMIYNTYIEFLVLNRLSNLEFRRQKTLYKLSKWERGGFGQNPKDGIFSQETAPYMDISFVCPTSTSKKEALICLLSNSSCSLSILLSSATFILHTLSVTDATLATNRLVSVNSTDYRKNREQPYYLGTWIEIFSCCELTWVWDNFWFCMFWRMVWSKDASLPFQFI